MTATERRIVYPPFIDVLHALEQACPCRCHGREAVQRTSDLDLDIMPSPSQQQDDAYTYESQNDQRLDELHSKLRSLRGVRPLSRISWRTCAHSKSR
jgi:hypothetical protein